ncbi:MAG: hypothetical protein IPN16_17080 [Gemmatimonadetes bacterium]|nr:hypothetical protein [Gemmatimonadota bacterium]
MNGAFERLHHAPPMGAYSAATRNELRAMLLSADHALLSLPTGQQILQMLASLRRCLTDFALRYQPFGDQASPRKRQFCRAQESDT